MKVFHASTVGDEEIDVLGHLNVRGYMRRIRLANTRLMAEIGLEHATLARRGASLIRTDTYSRYWSEQFAGTRLEVWGACLGTSRDAVSTVYAFRNVDRAVFVASFIIRYAARVDMTGARLRLDQDVMSRASAKAITVPSEWAPRSLTLDPIDPATEQVVAARFLASTESRLIDREVYFADAGHEGFLDEEDELLFSRSQHGDLPPRSLIGAAAVQVSSGQRLGWAMSETRLVSFARPRVHDVIRSFSADVALGLKTRTTRRWTINLRDGNLVAVQDAVTVAMDLDRRISVVIPVDLRAEVDRRIANVAAIRQQLSGD